MDLVKVFSGGEIVVLALKEKLEEEGIDAVIRNNHVANILPSLETNDIPVELFVEDVDLEKANPIVESFKMNM